jgi:hypothetical protein
MYSPLDGARCGPSIRPPYFVLSLTRPKPEAAATRARARRLLLLAQYVGDLHVHVEELGRAPVQADALALVQLAFAVVAWYALCRTGFVKARGLGRVG